MGLGITVNIKKLSPAACMPSYESSGAAGMDVSACLGEPLIIPAGGRLLIPTGLSLEIPVGFEAQVRPRSGLALKHGITVLNSPGTIDSDYRGELKIILINLGNEAFAVKHGDRIAQLVFAPLAQAELFETTALSQTARGDGGFGSTGRGS